MHSEPRAKPRACVRATKGLVVEHHDCLEQRLAINQGVVGRHLTDGALDDAPFLHVESIDAELSSLTVVQVYRVGRTHEKVSHERAVLIRPTRYTCTTVNELSSASMDSTCRNGASSRAPSVRWRPTTPWLMASRCSKQSWCSTTRPFVARTHARGLARGCECMPVCSSRELVCWISSAIGRRVDAAASAEASTA